MMFLGIKPTSGPKTQDQNTWSSDFCFLLFIFFNIYFYLLIWLSGLSCSMQDLFSCSMKTLQLWSLVPQRGIEPRPSASGAQNLSHWTTRKSLYDFKMYYSCHTLILAVLLLFTSVFLIILNVPSLKGYPLPDVLHGASGKKLNIRQVHNVSRHCARHFTYAIQISYSQQLRKLDIIITTLQKKNLDIKDVTTLKHQRFTPKFSWLRSSYLFKHYIALFLCLYCILYGLPRWRKWQRMCLPTQEMEQTQV